MLTTENLKVLILEENQSEIKLYESILHDSKINFESKNARTENEFVKLINRFKPDVILAGLNLTKFNVKDALAFLNEQSHLIPFIVIAGNITDEQAREYLKDGVDEFLTKYNLLSLPAAIIKSIEIKKTIREKLETDELNKEHEAKLRTFFHNNPESVFEIGFNNEFININQAGKELLEITETKLASKKTRFLDYIAPSKLKEYKEVFASACRGQKKSILLLIKRSKSDSLWLECKLLPLFDAEQAVSSILLIGINVTEKENVKSELTITRGNYKSLIASIDVALWSVDRDFRIIEFNEVASRMFYQIRGIKVKVGMPLNEFATIPARYLIWIERYNRALTGEKFFVEDVFDLNGEKFYAQITLYPLYVNENIVGISVLGRDITSVKKAEAELKQSAQKFRMLTENVPAGIFKLDSNGNCIYANQYTYRLLGTDPENLKDRNWMDFIYKKDAAEFKFKFENFLLLKNSIQSQIRFATENGQLIWTKVALRFIENESQKIVIGSITDISEIKNEYFELVDELIVSETVFNSLFEDVPQAIFIEDQEGKILNVNKKACELQGMEKSGLVGKNITELLLSGDKRKLMEDFKKLFNGDITEHTGKYFKITGETGNIKIKAMKISYKNNPAVLLNVKEI